MNRTDPGISLTSLTVSQLLDAFASSEPLPAGGSAAALTGAAGASLLMMAATLPRTRHGTPEEASELAAAAVRLRPVRDLLAGLIDRDAGAYSGVLAAMRLPKSTPEEQARRREELQAAMRRATEVPLEMMRASRAALGEAVIVAPRTASAATGDVAVAIELLIAAVRGSGGSVVSNLPMLKDPEYVGRMEAERQRLDAESAHDAESARGAL